MRIHFWYTGKCVVIASLKAGTQYMRWAFRMSPNNREWYGAEVTLNDLNPKTNLNNKFEILKIRRYQEIKKRFKNFTEEKQFISSLLLNNDITIIFFKRDPELKFISGVAQALGAVMNPTILMDQFKRDKLRDYKYLTSIIKRRKLINPSIFNHDVEFARDFNGRLFNLSNKLIHKVFYSKPGFMTVYKKFIKHCLTLYKDDILKDPHVEIRSDVLAYTILNYRKEIGLTNNNVVLFDLDKNLKSKEQSILSEFDITTTDDLGPRHSQVLFRDIVKECIYELPEKEKAIYIKYIEKRKEDSLVLDKFGDNLKFLEDKARLSKLKYLY